MDELEMQEEERVKNRVDRILLGIKPMDPNTDLRTTPTIDATPHQEPKGFLEKVGDGISGAAESISNAASNWANNRLQNMSMDIYSNLYDPDPDKEKRLEQAHKIGDPLGLPAQMLVDSKEAYEMAQNQYAWMKTQEIMQGRPFSANALKELYPELAEIAMNDPVSATLALKQADQILHDRGVITGATAGRMSGEPSAIGEAFKAFTDAWEAGQNMDEISEIGYAAKNGEITDEEMNRKIEAINARTKEYEGNSTVGLVATETVKQFSMMGAGMLRSLPEGAAAGLAVASIIGAPVVGAMMAGTIFMSSLRSNTGMNYYRLANKKNADGTPMYSRNEISGMATREAVLQAGVETGLMSLAYGTLGKVIGKSAAKAAIMNAGTRNKLLSASRGAMRKYALKEAAKQYAKGTAAEIAEEGWQDLISTTDEKMMGRDKNMTWKNMWNSAFDAMVEAIPAAVGMGMPGAVISGGGNYAGLKRLTKEDWHAAREAFYRENEKEMTQTVIKEREQNKVFKINPEVYAQKTQAQLDKEGMGTIYIDAAGAAETEEGRAALAQVVTDGIATAEQVDDAVKEGTQLELKAGIYMQKISEESAETLSNHAAFDKDGQTLHDIEEARKHIEKTRQIFNATKEAREAEVAKTILDRDFTDPEQKNAMEKIFAEGMDDIKENYKKVKAEALKTYEELINYKYYADYEPQGVEKVPVYEWSRDYEHGGVITSGYIGGSYIRTTNNDRWYANAWKKYGRKPNRRELYDIAEQEAINEIDSTSAFSEEEKQGYINSIQAARKEVETIESLEDYVKELDTRDIAARTLLSQKAYDDVYAPTLEQLKKAPAKAAEAAEESAFVYARLVDNFSKIYNLPVENIVASIQNGGKNDGYKQILLDFKKRLQLSEGKSYHADELETTATIKGNEFGEYADIKELREKALEYYKRELQGHSVYNELLGNIKFEEKEPDGEVQITGSGRKKMSSSTANPLKLLSIKSLKELISGANIITAAEATDGRHKGWKFYYLHSNVETNKGKQYVVVTVADKGSGAIDYYNHNIYTEEEYKKIESSINATLEHRVSSTGRFSQNTSLSSDLIIYPSTNIYKKKNLEQYKIYHQTINKDADIFFHGAVDPVEGDVIKEGYFHGMFYSSSRNSALGHGDRIYISEVNEDDIISAKSLAYEDGVYEIFQKKYGDDAELIYDLTTESRNIWNLNEDEKQKVYKLLGCTDEADADFTIQKEAALVADELGYKAVAVEDEHGTSYIILPGNKVYEESTYEKLNPDYNYRVYRQEHKGSYAGAYDIDQNILHIFEAANQSTVIHESAHWWLSMLNNIAADPELKELAKEDKVLEATLQKAQKDRDAIRAWASYYPDVMKEYKGTLIEKEFKEYETAIKKDPKNQELQERFIQERFARGFERYLLTGKAPTKELQGTFRRFKKWLINLYKTTKEIIKNPENYLGLKDPSDEVKEIFDHMMASEEEIEAWAEEKRWNLLYDDSLDYTQTEKENIKKWEEDIKELAKENALKYFMEKLHGQAMVDFEENILPQKVETFERKLGSQRIYGLEMLKKGNVFPTKKEWIRALKEEGFTEESYKDAVQEAGGTMEEQVEKYKKKQREEFIENISGKDHFRVEAEKVLESPEGKVKLAEIEQNAMRRKLRQYARIATASLIELDRLDPNMEGKISKKILYEIKKRNGFLSEEEKLKEEKAEQKKAKQATVEEINELKIKLRNTVDGLRTSQDSMLISPYELKAQARAFLYGKEIYKATNYRWWARKAASEGEKAAYFLKRGRWEEAARAKGRQSRFAMNAQVAHEYDDHVKHTLHGNPKASTNTLDKDGMEKYGLVGLINRASKATNNIRMPGNIRYFINHLAYQLGLITTDGRAPLGMDGEPAPFDWANLNNELDPTAAMEGDKPGDAVPQWIKKIFDDNNQTNLRELTVVDFDELVEVFKKIYKTGRREYEGNTFVNEKGESLSFEEAEDIIMAEIKAEKENPLYKKLAEKKWKKAKKEVGKWVADLALPEIIIERMGPKTYDMIYKMMDKAFAKKRLLKEQAELELKKVMNIYDRETFRKIRNDKIYEINKVDHKPVMVTKETLLTMALNWGTDSNRERVVETYGLDHRNIEKILFKYLNDKDWDFVEAVWKHINSYWPERNIVQNNLYGIPLGKVPGRKIILPDGRKINGMYYPIKYDADLTSKTKDREINDIIRKDMLGRTTFNIGMGSTKSRAQSSGGQYLRQDLDVYLDYINESINHIAMRETTADIYKLLSRKDLAEAISQKYGVDAHRRLQRWASDCWHDPVDKLTAWEQRLNRLRHNFTMATMAYRTSTALLNFANLPLVMEKMGAVNMARGLSAIYLGGVKNYRQQRDFILSKSTFMRDRATNMDRDLARGLKLKEEQDVSKLTSKAHAVKEEVDRFAYSLISKTDFMLSLPEWIQTYNNTIAQLQIEKPFMTVAEMDEEAVRLADKMVRETFGSGEMKDRPEVVKSRLLSQLLPFYSFTSLVMNQFIRGGYDIVDGRGPMKLMRAMLFWYILGSVFEGALRSLVDWATGNDKYSFLQRQGYSFASNGPIGGIPVAREVIPGLYSLFAGMYSDGGKMSVTGLNIFEDVFQTAMAIKSDKKDWIDVGQAGTKVFNKITGLSDTLTDALWAIARLTTTDTDATAWEALFSIIFDRRIKKKGEKK
nr:MAG TPA: crystallin beta/gamma motif-containing protein [Caudoviricetes sp.]